MISPSREITNIPISFSLLYEKEYKNLFLFLTLQKNREKSVKRRAYTEIKSSTVMGMKEVRYPLLEN